MGKITQSNAGNAEETAAAAEELNAQAQNMQESLGELLRLVGNAVTASAAHGQKTQKSRASVPMKESPALPAVATATLGRARMPMPATAGQAQDEHFFDS